MLQKDFNPVLRFMVVSDVHYKDEHCVEEERMEKGIRIIEISKDNEFDVSGAEEVEATEDNEAEATETTETTEVSAEDASTYQPDNKTTSYINHGEKISDAGSGSTNTNKDTTAD